MEKDKEKIIKFLNDKLVPLLPQGVEAFLAGSILTGDFGPESDVDVFLRSSSFNVNFMDLKPFIRLACEFYFWFGRELHVYPTNSTYFLKQKQVKLPFD